MAHTLMVYDGTTDATSAGPRTGGIPLAPADFAWPRCDTCRGAMQFLAHLPFDDAVVAVFSCANEPGQCAQWEAFEGGNRAFLFPPDGLVPATVPEAGETRLGAVTAIRTEVVDEDAYDDARGVYGARVGRGRAVLGSWGGEPDWYDPDGWPSCPQCARRMDFVAHLEEGYEHRTAANFGGGLGYVLTCAPCTRAVFLTQG
ncbi:hypothetical protein ACFWIA_20375 [Streptomyces sp. NPDC127068]|uniref:hypothetical protein n=1 Tax=Streptomyces sp. NPDC127068 TaxID=3347127 RepID=UPI003655DC7E